MKKFVFSFILMSLLATISFEQALAGQPFQASVTPDIAVHDSNVLIRGLAISLWGENPQEALAFGIVNGSVGNSRGFSWSWLLNYAENYSGVHWAFVNHTSGDFLGWQCGGINYTRNQVTGVQTGWVNYARQMQGVQLGLINFAGQSRNTLIQLGLINVIQETRGWFTEFPDAVAPGMVFFNWRF